MIHVSQHLRVRLKTLEICVLTSLLCLNLSLYFRFLMFRSPGVVLRNHLDFLRVTGYLNGSRK